MHRVNENKDRQLHSWRHDTKFSINDYYVTQQQIKV